MSHGVQVPEVVTTAWMLPWWGYPKIFTPLVSMRRGMGLLVREIFWKYVLEWEYMQRISAYSSLGDNAVSSITIKHLAGYSGIATKAYS